MALLRFADVRTELGVPRATAYRLAQRGDYYEFGVRRMGHALYVVESIWRQFFPEPGTVVPVEPEPPPPTHRQNGPRTITIG